MNYKLLFKKKIIVSKGGLEVTKENRRISLLSYEPETRPRGVNRGRVFDLRF